MADSGEKQSERPDVSDLESGPGYAEGEMRYSDRSPAEEERGDLPKGMAEKVETVEVSTLTPKR